jgi:hypothetical protein
MRADAELKTMIIETQVDVTKAVLSELAEPALS